MALGEGTAALGAFYYVLLFTALAHYPLLRPVPMGLTFNDMLYHLLHGQFDVDPGPIGWEGFIHAGKTYSYFGIIGCAICAGTSNRRDIPRLADRLFVRSNYALRRGAANLLFDPPIGRL